MTVIMVMTSQLWNLIDLSCFDGDSNKVRLPLEISQLV